MSLVQKIEPTEAGGENSGPEISPDLSQESVQDSSKETVQDSGQEGTAVLERTVAELLPTVPFEENYLETIQKIGLSHRISFEDMDELLGVWENRLYYISYKERGLSIYKLDFLEEDAEPEAIYSLEEGSLWYYRSMIKDKIYLLVLETSEKEGRPFRIDEISLDGQVQEIYSKDSAHAPIVYDLPEHLIVNYEADGYCVMEAVGLEDHLVKQIDKRELARDGKGNMSGDYILYGGGVEPDGFYYEIISLENEYLDAEGSAAVYYYDFETESADIVLNPPNKSHFLSGGRDYIVRCIYAYEAPLSVSGEFYRRQGDELNFCKMYELYTTNDLLWLKELRDGCAAGYTAQENILILDVERMQKSAYSIPEKGMKSSNVVLADGKIYYVYKENALLCFLILK